MGHAHFITNIVDYGMDPQAAIDGPRVFFEGDGRGRARRSGSDATTGLRRVGHECPARALPLGGGQAIRIDWRRGVLIGGSDRARMARARILMVAHIDR